MSDQNIYPASVPSQPAPEPPKQRRKLLRKSVVIPVAALALGLGMGSAAAGGQPETVEVVKEVKVPGPVETVQAEPEVKTETVEVEVTPDSCYLALSYADEIFALTGEFLQGVETMPAAEQDRMVEEVDGKADLYIEQREACRDL